MSTDRYISIERFKAISDGVIAVALTLLVLGITVPNLSSDINNQQLLSAVANLSPDLIAYLISFVLIYKLWQVHSFIFQQIELIDDKIVWLNGHFLFFISFLPFATRLMSAFHASFAVIFFDICIILPQVMLNIIDRYLFSKKYYDEILTDQKKMIKHKAFHIRSLSIIVIAMLSMTCSFFNVAFAGRIWLVLLILPLFEKKLKK